MQLEIIKKPEFENDDFLLHFNHFKISSDTELALRKDPYYEAKRSLFSTRSTMAGKLASFSERPSLKGVKPDTVIVSTIYTAAVEAQNAVDYQSLLHAVKKELATKPGSRRVVLRFLNPAPDYFYSSDVSCLAFIQYLLDDEQKLDVKIVYRASDIKNELYYDLLCIYEFFIKEVSQEANVAFYATTGQNALSLDETCRRIKKDFV